MFPYLSRMDDGLHDANFGASFAFFPCIQFAQVARTVVADPRQWRESKNREATDERWEGGMDREAREQERFLGVPD